MKTRGGWETKKIWEVGRKVHGGVVVEPGFYAIHKPGTVDESCPIFHRANGEALTAFSINEPPSYDGHPADIVDFGEGQEQGLKTIAQEVAVKANECCHRSDGWEEALSDFIYETLLKAKNGGYL